MDEKELLDIRIDISNILDICVMMAKHRIGEVTDEQYKKNLRYNEDMLKNTQRRLALQALEHMCGEMHESIDIESLLKKGDDA